MSKKLLPAEMNYPTHERELLAIVCALKEWRHYLFGNHFTVFTDHRPLQHIQNQPHLSARQTRWSEFLQQFDFTIEYQQGKSNVVADALSRRSDHKVEQSEVNLTVAEIKVDDIESKIKKFYECDQVCVQLLKDSTERDKLNIKLDEANGLLYKDDRLYVPDHEPTKSFILSESHDSPLSGHVGTAKTIELVKRLFYWPKMDKEIKCYVQSCEKCQSNKASNRHPQGLLQTLPVPQEPWEQVTMDLITQLPNTKKKNDAIVVFVDKLTKMTHLVPTKTTISAPQLAEMFYKEIIRLHGIPKSIVSDRDPRFTSKFWKCLWKLLGTKLAMSTAYHPQTDGQTERMNRTLEDMLRAYVNFEQDNWDEHLTAAEIAINNSQQASTRFSPYYLNYGRHPILPISMDKSKTRIDQVSNPTAGETYQKFHGHIENARKNLELARKRQTFYTNQKRTEVEYEVGQMVYLSTTNLNMKSQTPKLTPRFIGPFKIIQKVGKVAYKLEFPNSIKIHPVVHVSKLRKHKDGQRIFPSRPTDVTRPPPDVITATGLEEYEVERIVDHRYRGREKSKKLEYLVIWKGYPEYESTWQKEQDLENAKRKVEEYWDRKKKKFKKKKKK